MAKKAPVRRVHPMRKLSDITARKIRRLILQLEKDILEKLKKHPEFADLSPGEVDHLVSIIDDSITVTKPKIEKTLGAAIEVGARRGVLDAVKKQEKVSTPEGMGKVVSQGLKKDYVKLDKGGFKWFDKDKIHKKKLSDVFLPRDKDMLEKQKFIATSMFKTLGEDIKSEAQKILTDVIRTGKSPRDAIPRIKNLFQNYKPGKKKETKVRYQRMDKVAESMTRTLVVESYNEAEYKRHEASGVVWGHEWIAAHDERTCPFCGGHDKKGAKVNNEPFDGQTREIGKNFSSSYKNRTITVAKPPAHINCRCRLVPITFYEAKRRGLR